METLFDNEMIVKNDASTLTETKDNDVSFIILLNKTSPPTSVIYMIYHAYEFYLNFSLIFY